MVFLAVFAVLSLAAGTGFGAEDEVKVGADDGAIMLYKGKPYLHVMHKGRSVKVQRVQDRPALPAVLHRTDGSGSVGQDDR